MWKVPIATVAKQGWSAHWRLTALCFHCFEGQSLNVLVDVLLTHGWLWSSERKASVMDKLWLWFVCLNVLQWLYNLRTTCFLSWQYNEVSFCFEDNVLVLQKHKFSPTQVIFSHSAHIFLKMSSWPSKAG